MHENLTMLKGRPLSVAILALGYPSNERYIAGLRLVEWSNSVSRQEKSERTTSSSGTTYNAQHGSTAYNETSTYTVPVTREFTCTITLEVVNDIINSFTYQGYPSVCAHYTDALSTVLRQ